MILSLHYLSIEIFPVSVSFNLFLVFCPLSLSLSLQLTFFLTLSAASALCQHLGKAIFLLYKSQSDNIRNSPSKRYFLQIHVTK